MRFLILLFLFLGACNPGSEKDSGKSPLPKLIIGIVVDQMRYEMLDRFEPYFGENGIKRLRREGFEYKQNYFNYAQTLTGPGHASIATGSPPSIHGIAGNGWFDATRDHIKIYCVEDNQSHLISLNPQDSTILRSPRNLKVPTIGDLFKKSFGKSSKVVGISLKDRAANLSAGKDADAAFWMMNDGYWGSSTYFFDSIPNWVNVWNREGALWKYSDSVWSPLKDNYSVALPDSNDLESPYSGFTSTTLPYDFGEITNRNGPYDLWYSPYGDLETRLFFQLVLKEMELGQDQIPDFVAISFSSTDKIGHRFGPYSQELADEYVRLDKQLEKLLNFLDQEVGKNQYLLYLTADHGVANIPGTIDTVNNGGGQILTKQICGSINDSLASEFEAEGLIRAYKDEQVYFDILKIDSLDLNAEEVFQEAKKYFEKHSGIQRAVLVHKNPKDQIDSLVLNGVFPGRSGQLCLVYEPGWIETKGTGTDHGSPHHYDRHVPLLWYGSAIEKGQSERQVSITQIVATICELLGIEIENESEAKTLDELLIQ